jgi:hypothetical protein
VSRVGDRSIYTLLSCAAGLRLRERSSASMLPTRHCGHGLSPLATLAPTFLSLVGHVDCEVQLAIEMRIVPDREAPSPNLQRPVTKTLTVLGPFTTETASRLTVTRHIQRPGK